MNAELVRSQPFIDCTRGNGFSYFRISKSMLELGQQLGISVDEVLLYTLLRDRAKWSYENKNYSSDGRIFVYCTRANAAAYFGWSTRKVVGLFHSLSNHHLIEEVPCFDVKGKQKASHIFLNIWTTPGLSFSQSDFMACKFPQLTIHSLFTLDIGDYYILPKVLLEDSRYHGLSLRAMLLYMLLLDRLSLSQRYGRVDENGLLWTTMDSDLMSKELGCSTRSITRATGELDEIGLIERHSVSYAEKWKIYIRDFLPVASEATPDPDSAHLKEQDCSFDCSIDRNASLCSQICSPSSSDMHPFSANSASPVSPELQTIKPSFIKHSDIYPSKKTNIHDSCDALEKRKNEERNEAIKTMELKMSCMELCHYSETLDLCYLGMHEEIADKALEILDFMVDTLADLLRSHSATVVLGQKSISMQSFIQKIREADEFIIFLTIQKMIPTWASVKDKTAYVKRILYLAGRQHRQEAFFLRKTVENGSFDNLNTESSFGKDL